VLIHTGMNDIFREGEGAVEVGREAIQRILYATARAKQRVIVLECQPADWMDTPPAQDLQAAYDAWNTMLREEAGGQPGVGVLDTCESWDPTLYTDSPQYHPNDDGHALIAEELNELLRSS
jgi:lysophospholipase L1-like esterase